MLLSPTQRSNSVTFAAFATLSAVARTSSPTDFAIQSSQQASPSSPSPSCEAVAASTKYSPGASSRNSSGRSRPFHLMIVTPQLYAVDSPFTSGLGGNCVTAGDTIGGEAPGANFSATRRTLDRRVGSTDEAALRPWHVGADGSSRS